jgi:hypothetical protein
MNLAQIIQERARLAVRWHRDPVNQLADIAGMPKEYIECSFCGAQDWRYPPHGLSEPCPLVVDMFSSMGMKVDADRMLAVRSGLQMETIQEFIEQQMRAHREETDEDE